MAREPVQETIDEIKYTFGRHTPKNSRRIFSRILKIVAPSLAAGVGKTSLRSIDELLDQKIDLGSAVTMLCSRMDEKEVEEIIDNLFDQILHNGNSDQKGLGNCKKNYDAIFADTGIAHVFKVIKQALFVEYDNFFGEGVSLQERLNAAKDMTPEKQI